MLLLTLFLSFLPSHLVPWDTPFPLTPSPYGPTIGPSNQEQWPNEADCESVLTATSLRKMVVL